MKNKIAIGCLVQWYEIKLVGEYLQSLRNAIDFIDNSDSVFIDICFNVSEKLEKLDTDVISMDDIKKQF